MTDEQRVKEKWPDALAYQWKNGWGICNHAAESKDFDLCMGAGLTVTQAWADAAKRIGGTDEGTKQ